MSRNNKKAARAKQKKSLTRASRTKAKLRQKNIAAHHQSNEKKAERLMYLNAIARKDPRLFKLMDDIKVGKRENSKPLSEKEFKENVENIVGASSFIAIRMQLMSVIGLDEFGITKDEHIEFEEAIVNVFGNVEELMGMSKNIDISNMDLLSDISSAMMVIYEMIERINSGEFREKYADALKKVDEYRANLLKSWEDRGHSNKDLEKAMLTRYLTDLFDAKEQARLKAEEEAKEAEAKEAGPVGDESCAPAQQEESK